MGGAEYEYLQRRSSRNIECSECGEWIHKGQEMAVKSPEDGPTTFEIRDGVVLTNEKVVCPDCIPVGAKTLHLDDEDDETDEARERLRWKGL